MAQFMRNRSGVVFYRDESLLSKPELGFAVCDAHGADLPAKAEEPVAPPSQPKKAAKRTKAK